VLEQVKEQPEGPEEGENVAGAPLSERDLKELERARKGKTREERRAACTNLLSTGKNSAREAVAKMLKEVPKAEIRCDVLCALGKARAADARSYIEEALFDKSADVRSYAAVALEDLAEKGSIEPLIKRVKKERDTNARKNMYCALGTCGGGSADEDAAKQLLKGLSSDKQATVKKFCALAMRHYEGAGAKLVVPKLEKQALKLKDRTIRGAVVYTLAFIGNPRTTVPVLEKVLEKQRDDWGRNYVRTAISMVKGTGGDFGRSSWWLFREHREDPARQG
jgi:HEAT repeat protein